jgi:hypothetical protein
MSSIENEKLILALAQDTKKQKFYLLNSILEGFLQEVLNNKPVECIELNFIEDIKIIVPVGLCHLNILKKVKSLEGIASEFGATFFFLLLEFDKLIRELKKNE